MQKILAALLSAFVLSGCVTCALTMGRPLAQTPDEEAIVRAANLYGMNLCDPPSGEESVSPSWPFSLLDASELEAVAKEYFVPIEPDLLPGLRARHALLCSVFGVPQETGLDGTLEASSVEIVYPADDPSAVSRGGIVDAWWFMSDSDIGSRERRRVREACSVFQVTSRVSDKIIEPEATVRFDLMISPNPFPDPFECAELPYANSEFLKQPIQLHLVRDPDDGVWVVVGHSDSAASRR